jgi:hypothetical protein
MPLTAFSACNIVNGKAYGECAGITINSATKEFIEISSYSSESGIISGAQIKNGGTLFLSGTSNGNLSVDKGGKLYVTGVVYGTITNNGGVIEIEGDVSYVVANLGTTLISGIADGVFGKGKVVYRKGAVIGGNPVEQQ